MKKLWELGAAGVLAMATTAMVVAGSPAYVQAQAAPASLHGKVNNAIGQPLKTGDVKLTTDKTSEEKDRKYPYSFPIDANGAFTGTGIAPGDYLAVVFSEGKSVDFQTVTLKAGENRELNFDMTREEYMKALSPEQRAAIEELKKKNAGAMAENSKIANINATLQDARAKEKAGQADDAVAELQPLTAQRPDEPILWASLGEAQLAAGDAATKAAKAAKTSPTDPAIMQKYTDAATSYQKAIDLNAASKKPSPDLAASSYLNLGQADAKSGKLDDAAKAYDAAVKASPTMAGMAYFNEAAVFFNAGKMDEAAAAADKAIEANPKRAEAYYIKGQALIGKATVDPKTNKIVAPPGCVDAYQQYLELDPTGAHAQDVKDLLTNLGQPIRSSYKAGKKS